MRQTIALSWVLLFLLFLIPLLLLSPLVWEEEPLEEDAQTVLPLEQATAFSTANQELDTQVELEVLMDDGTVATLSLADYLWGVVAAEMPATFELEALKAQAVAARTYTISKMGQTSTQHPDAHVCTDYTCCQAYITPQDAQENWGEDTQAYSAIITQAVAETDGVILCYQGEPIQALFHSSSPGQTVDAVAVWGTDVPYLTSVASPEGEEVPNWQSSATFDAQTFQNLITQSYPQANFSGDISTWCADLILDSSGMVSTLTVGGVTISGTTLRTLLSLRSATFSVTTGDNQLTFSVTGYGHGVGMSQYGANEMALQGERYEDILLWYYTGVELSTLTPPNPS